MIVIENMQQPVGIWAHRTPTVGEEGFDEASNCSTLSLLGSAGGKDNEGIRL